MFGTTQEMARPYSGSSIHAPAQRLLYPDSRTMDSRSLASTCRNSPADCRCCHYLPHLEAQT